MKLVIITVPDTVNTDVIRDAMIEFAATTKVSIRVNILESEDLMPEKPAKTSRVESAYIRAIKKIMEVCGDITRNPADRAKFYELVLKKEIEKSILGVLILGPSNPKELHALQDAGGQKIKKIVTTALSLCETLE